MTEEIDRDRLRALAEDALVDVHGADRCQALGIMPAAHQLHRRLRETTRAILELLDALEQAEAEKAVQEEKVARKVLTDLAKSSLRVAATAKDNGDEGRADDARFVAGEVIEYRDDRFPEGGGER